MRRSLELASPPQPDAPRAACNDADEGRQVGDFEAALPSAQRAFDASRRLSGGGHQAVPTGARLLAPVLAAGETGVGKARSGSGVVGLSTALKPPDEALARS